MKKKNREKEKEFCTKAEIERVSYVLRALLNFNQVNVSIYSTESGKQVNAHRVKMRIRQNHKINECNEFWPRQKTNNKQTNKTLKQTTVFVCVYFFGVMRDRSVFVPAFDILHIEVYDAYKISIVPKKKFCRQNEIDFDHIEFGYGTFDFILS